MFEEDYGADAKERDKMHRLSNAYNKKPEVLEGQAQAAKA